MHKLGFFINEWRKLSEAERKKTFGLTSEFPIKMQEKKVNLDDLVNLTENKPFLNMSAETQEDVNRWGNEMRDAYLANVCKIIILTIIGFKRR